MVLVKLKWGKELVEVQCDLSQPVAAFKAAIQAATKVPPERQTIKGVKGGALKDDADLKEAGITEGKMLMLIGQAASDAEEPPQAPRQPVVFAEDAGPVGHHEKEAMSNGLKNLGNSCYLNSAVQSLRMVPEARELLTKSASPVARNLAALYETLDKTRDAVVPVSFYTAFITNFPMFMETDDRGHPMQQDSQEALSKVLQLLEANREAKTEAGATFASLFQGEMTQSIKLGEPTGSDELKAEDETTVQINPFMMLQCNISKEAQTLEHGLIQGLTEDFRAQSRLLKREAQFSRASLISRLPQYLFVHMIRFAWRDDTKKKAKILKPITFPMVLDVFNMCNDELKKQLEPAREQVKIARDKEIERRKEAKRKDKAANNDDDDAAPKEPEVMPDPQISGMYECCAIISHRGRDADGGHYVCWAKKGDAWLLFDDDNCGQVNEEEVKRLAGSGEGHIAYILLYRSWDPVTKKYPLLL